MADEKPDEKPKDIEKKAKPPGKKIGKVTHFYDKIGVGIIELADSIKVGDSISIQGNRTDFSQNIASMQIEHKQVEEAKKGDVIGMKVDQEVREGDTVYLTS